MAYKQINYHDLQICQLQGQQNIMCKILIYTFLIAKTIKACLLFSQ